MEKGYKNLGYFFLILVPLVGFGFFKTYFGLAPEFNVGTTWVVHTHAVIMGCWMLLMIAQPFLIRYKQHQMHRALGKVSYVLVPLVIGSFILMMIKHVTDGDAQSIPRSQLIKDLLFPFFDTILLSSFYTLAIINRKDSALHMRYMIAVALIFLNPTLGRIFSLWFNMRDLPAAGMVILIVDLILGGLIYFDVTHQRKFRPYLVAAAFFATYQLTFFLAYF